jgi:hypothetical protein
MPDLGRLRWVMDVDTTRFDSSLRRARAGIRAVGAAMAAMGAGRAISAAGERAERLVQGAGATGADIGYLQEMEFAGGQAGVAPQDMMSGLIAFSRNVALLRQGKGPLKKVGGRASRLLRQVAQAQGLQAQVETLSGGLGGLEPGLAGAVLERAGLGGPGMQELLSGGPEGLAAERAKFYRYGTPMAQGEAEALKKGGDVVAAVGGGAMSYLQREIGQTARGLELLWSALTENTRATQDNTRSGAKLGP